MMMSNAFTLCLRYAYGIDLDIASQAVLWRSRPMSVWSSRDLLQLALLGG